MHPADETHLAHAARLALRGHGGAEPNPLVGCVIVANDGTIVGWGYHRRCGDDHAEIAALRRAGARARGATAYTTLEPCNHTGRTGPCAEALVDAGVSAVVLACRDPNDLASGGIEKLRSAGVEVRECPCPAASRLLAPFAHRCGTGLPWITAKWAQTLDGRIATRTGESRWISGEQSRRMVHRERGRVDAIMVGVGTVVADDPSLTARDVRVRRRARRVIVDPTLRTPPRSALVRTARETPTTIICRADARGAEHLESAGVEIVGVEGTGDVMPLAGALRELARRHDMTNVLVEGGGRLLGHLFREELVNEAWVFVAPRVLGDTEAIGCVTGLAAASVADGVGMTLTECRRRGGDVVLRYDVVH